MPTTVRTAANPGLPDDTRPDWSRTMEGRIAQWCAWFDVPPPAPSWRTGGEAAEGVLLDWSDDARANLDWIILGDPRGMARLWRDREVGLREFTEAVLPLSAAEMRLLSGIAQLLLQDLISPGDVPELAKLALSQHRAAADAPAEREA